MNLYICTFEEFTDGYFDKVFDQYSADTPCTFSKGDTIWVKDFDSTSAPPIGGDRYFIAKENGSHLWYEMITPSIVLSDLYSACPQNTDCRHRPYHFVTRGIINEYVSLNWKDCYKANGVFTLVVPNTRENRDILMPGRYILIKATDRVMVIEKINTSNNLLGGTNAIEVSGRSLESILDRRVAFPGYGLDTTTYKSTGGLRKAVHDLVNGYFISPEDVSAVNTATGEREYTYPERKVWGLENVIDDADLKTPFNNSVNKSVSKDDLLTIISDLCGNSNLGFKIIPAFRYGSKAMQFEFRTYTGSDRSYYREDPTTGLLVFAPKYGNVEKISTVKDQTNYKNFVFCAKEKEAETYIDLTQLGTNSVFDGDSILDNIDFIASAKNWLFSKLKGSISDSSIMSTAIYIICIAAMQTNKGYDQTIVQIDGSEDVPDYPDDYIPDSKINVVYKRVITGGTDNYGTFISGGQQYSGLKYGNFDICEDDTLDKFIESTAYGWLTPAILREANSGLENADWDGWGNSLKKAAIKQIFSALDKYTSTYNQTKWLCETYNAKSHAEGLDRREVFVDEESDDNNQWNNSKMVQFMNSSSLITDSEEEEETDDEILKRLKETARKRSGEYLEEHYVDATCESLTLEYRKDYELGDIVQVDDDAGSDEQYYVSEVVISDDTQNGYRNIPTFDRYDALPTTYERLDYLAVANMELPVLFNDANQGLNNILGIDLGEKGVIDEGPNYTKSSGGWYVDGVYCDRRYSWTEFELVAARKQIQPEQGEPVNFKDSFAIMSVPGSLTLNGHSFPFMVCDTVISPLNFSHKWNDNRLMGGTNDRRISMLIDDVKKDILTDKPKYSRVGASIKYYPDTIEGVSTNPILTVPTNGDESIYSAAFGADVYKTYKINTPVKYSGNESGRTRTRIFSKSTVDNEVIGFRPMFNDWYLIRNGYELMVQSPLYPRLIKDLDAGDYFKPTGGYKEQGAPDYNFYTHGLFPAEVGSGADFGLSPYSPVIFSSALSKNICLGGIFNESFVSGEDRMEDYRDSANGLCVKRLKVYTYDAALRDNHLASNPSYHYNIHVGQVDNSGTSIVPEDPTGTGKNEYDIQTTIVDLNSRKLAHEYIPVRYTDYGDIEPAKEEQYGLYDLIQKEFIPVNYGGNDFAIFIQAGGIVRKE